MFDSCDLEECKMKLIVATAISLMVACRVAPKEEVNDTQGTEETGETVVDCPITMSLLSGESYTPSVVRLYFTLRDCNGNGVIGKTGEDFSVLEDSSEISIFESEQQIISSSLGYDIKSLLLLDMSGSIVDSGNLGSLQSAATSFVQSLNEQEVAIYAFDGRQEIQEVVGFTDDTNALQAGIASLSTYEIVDNSTNLNGSVIKGLEVLSQAESQSTGTLFSGSLTVFTDGSDQAGWNSNTEAIAAVSSSNHSVYSVGLGGEVDESHLSSLGTDGSWTATDVNELQTVFGELSSEIVNRSNSLYILAYCSPKRNGEHSLELSLNGEEASIFYSFDATGFEGGCSPDDFVQDSTPVLVEDCTDGVDNDEDGEIDCNDADCEGTADCVEDCTDGVDNDADGDVDCDDTDCTDITDCLADNGNEPCYAIQLTSTDASITVNNTGFGVGEGDWTFEFWIRIDNLFSHGGGTNLFCQNENYAAYAIRPSYTFDGNNAGRVHCNTYNNTSGGHNLTAYSEVIDDGEWHHVACNYSSGLVTVYTDGVPGQTDTGNPQINATSSMSIGNPAGYDGYQAPSVSFGPIRYSSTARYGSDFTPIQDWTLDANTIAQYLVLNGFDGSVLTDEAGGDNNGSHRQGVIAAGTCD